MWVRRNEFFEAFVGALILTTIIGATVFGNPLWLFLIVPATAFILFIVMCAWCLLDILIGALIWDREEFSSNLSIIIIILLLICAALFTPLGPFFWIPGWWSLPSIVLGFILMLRLVLEENILDEEFI